MKISLPLIILFIIISACTSAQPNPTATLPPTNIPVQLTDTSTAFRTPTLIPLATQTPVTSSPTPKPTATQIPGTTKKCLEVLPETPLRSISDEGWVVYSKAPSSTRVFINLKTEEQHEFSHQLSETSNFSTGASSPNRKYYAIREFQTNEDGYVIDRHIWVVNVQGEILADLENELAWRNFHWVNGEQLEILYISEEQQWPFNALIINPLTGEREDIPASLPGIHTTYYPDQTPGWVIAHSPSLEQVIYLRNDEDGYWNEVVLWSRASRAPLWQRNGSFSMYSTRPVWSPNGDQVAVVVNDELYLIAQTGQETRTPSLGKDVVVENYSWSPDSLWVAFWVNFWQEQDGMKGQLFLLNTTTNTITDYCFKNMGGGRPPQWSPDSQQIIINTLKEYDDGSKEAISILIDIVNGKAYQIPDDEFPFHWMVLDQKD